MGRGIQNRNTHMFVGPPSIIIGIGEFHPSGET
jgi:hypothetical protein